MLIRPGRIGAIGRTQPTGGGAFNNPSLPRFSQAVRNTMLGISDTNVAFIGDSETSGTGAGEGNTAFVNARARSVPSVVADLVSGRFPIERHAIWGTGNVPDADLPDMFPGMVFGSGWVSSDANSIGPTFTNGTTTEPFTIPFPAGADTFDIYWIGTGASGVFSVQIDSGSVTNFTTAGANSFTKVTVPAPDASAHTVTIRRVSGGTVYIQAPVPRSSTTKKINIWNMGVGSSTTASWTITAEPWSRGAALQSLPIDLTVIALGVNDWAGGNTSAYETNMGTIIDRQKVLGDVLLVAQPGISGVSNAPFKAVLDSLSASKGVPLIDVDALFGGYSGGVAKGWYFDTVHPNIAGYAAWGGLEAPTIFGS